MLRLAGAAHTVRVIEQSCRSAHVACCASLITCQARGYAEAALDALSGDGTVMHHSTCGTELVLLRSMPCCCSESMPPSAGAGEAREPLDVLQAEVRMDSGKRAAAKMRKVSSEPTSHAQGGSGIA